MSGELTGASALVTGAGSGIGRATAIRFAKAGAAVGVADIDFNSAKHTADLVVQAGGDAIAIEADVSSAEQVSAMVRQMIEKFDRLDIAINNAGIVTRLSKLADMTDEEWDRSIAVNLTGMRNCMRAELQEMRRRSKGSIVNISSGAGLRAIPLCSAYVASKHGVIGITRTAALEHVLEGIRINAICPGYVDTPIHDSRKTSDGDARDTSKMFPMGRPGRPEEIAEAALWLASDKASYVTGVALPVDGGWQA
jgi:NAD(P)-dependent dehydrogenase (short-subunit alcohol dehydrogenase family)